MQISGNVCAVTSSGSREGVLAYIASKAHAPSRLPLEVTHAGITSLLQHRFQLLISRFLHRNGNRFIFTDRQLGGMRHHFIIL
jgi:hypothetical protein